MHLWQGFRNQKGQCNLHTLPEEPCLSDKYLASLNCPYHQWFPFRVLQVQTSKFQLLTCCMTQEHYPGSDLACSDITQQSLPLTHSYHSTSKAVDLCKSGGECYPLPCQLCTQQPSAAPWDCSMLGLDPVLTHQTANFTMASKVRD